ncbi:MAG: thioredoxin family protein [Flavobacteriaceae bacterium]|nr:thioredoxin family protein [Flavobacteriaceae bacterium]
MKKLVALFLGLLLNFTVSAQMVEPVTWTSSIEKISDTEYYLIFNATIEEDWHLYSQHNPDGASLPIEFTSDAKGKDFEFIGLADESETHTAYSEIWEKDEIYFEYEGTLRQKIKLLKSDVKSIEIEFSGQACKEACVPISATFIFDIPALDSPITAKSDTSTTKENDATIETPIETPTSNKGLLIIFGLAFLGGLTALLTPCVFPMIPMTVSFFTKQSKSKAAGIRNAIFYGLSIIVIYVGLGLSVSTIFGPAALNALSTNVWFNVIFFILLVTFALSFLGAFEITLPSSWGTKIDSQADRGGYVGIFFMALALAIVSFSCTGPIVGTLLVEAASGGGFIGPIVGMLGFSLALAIPFALFAAFPGWLNSLPKSGGWLNTVKVVLGFLELALAFKFLSNADLVLQLHWLERETFLAIWIAIFGALTLYLFGKIQLPHDSPLTGGISVGRLCLGLLSATLVVYMIPGLWGAPLKLISGFPPPAHYSESPYGVGFKKLGGGPGAHAKLPEGAHLGPHDIIAFTDYETGMAYARKVNKPALVDFTGHACVNCRKMEDYVWSQEKVLSVLNNDIVLISLYVDDKRKLPKDEQYISEHTGKKIRTIGNKWSEFQTINYKANAQPYYVLVDGNAKQLNAPSAYNTDVDSYYQWLMEGINNFK